MKHVIRDESQRWKNRKTQIDGEVKISLKEWYEIEDELNEIEGLRILIDPLNASYIAMWDNNLHWWKHITYLDTDEALTVVREANQTLSARVTELENRIEELNNAALENINQPK